MSCCIARRMCLAALQGRCVLLHCKADVTCCIARQMHRCRNAAVLVQPLCHPRHALHLFLSLPPGVSITVLLHCKADASMPQMLECCCTCATPLSSSTCPPPLSLPSPGSLLLYHSTQRAFSRYLPATSTAAALILHIGNSRNL